MPPNPISLPLGQSLAIKSLIPQGWGFFTRNPREPQILFFEESMPGQWEEVNLSNRQVRHFFGLGRGNRFEMMALQTSLQGVPEDQWRDCSGPTRKYTDSVPDAYFTTGPTGPLARVVRAECFIARIQEVVPWSWFGDVHPDEMPAKCAHICTNPK